MLGDVLEMIEKIPTCELVDEIVRRGCTKVMVPPYGVGSVRVVDVNEELKFAEHYEGPVVMIVIND